LRIPVKVVSDVHIEVVREAVPPLRLDIFRGERRQCEEPWERLFAELIVIGPCCPQLAPGVSFHKVVFELVSLCEVLDSRPCPRVLRGEDEGDGVSAVASVPDKPNVFALDVRRQDRHSEKLPDRVGHVHHWGTPFHERECPECCLVDCLVAKSVALGLVSLDPALPIELAANDRVLMAIRDCLESRCDCPPWSLVGPLSLFVAGLPLVLPCTLVAAPPIPVTLLWMPVSSLWSILSGMFPNPRWGLSLPSWF
jgi:hypothetical protein